MMQNDEAVIELVRAQKSMHSAEVLLKNALYEDAASRAYYCVLHAAKAMLRAHDIDASSHDAVRRLFGLHIINKGLVDKKYATILHEGYDIRCLADYDVARGVERGEAEQSLNDAEIFLSTMTRYVKQNFPALKKALEAVDEK